MPSAVSTSDYVSRRAAIVAWATHCIRYGMSPEHALGKSYPGHEADPVTPGMVREIAAEVRRRGH